jgi:hypothetical protein
VDWVLVTKLAVQIRSIWLRASSRCLLTFQVRVEERDDPAAGITRRRLVVAGAGDPGQEAGDFAGLTPGLVQEAVPGVGILLDVVVDP